ncbi:hypothetical protein LZZ85_11440 [Terrimonas sp. NA20]|uniref:Uncharacterized protein n=1 Tax=Terrimonas ginsenosidimutans TaxID=2908004 RepID=A0ABS9KRE1_9BACT|nr:hypothetical protein [Terrimonas ginsenosidimutans]MCG2614902.1 hypothetical protein [Terrimonas ginsenosidimutans]
MEISILFAIFFACIAVFVCVLFFIQVRKNKELMKEFKESKLLNHDLMKEIKAMMEEKNFLLKMHRKLNRNNSDNNS